MIILNVLVVWWWWCGGEVVVSVVVTSDDGCNDSVVMKVVSVVVTSDDGLLQTAGSQQGTESLSNLNYGFAD